MSLPRCPVCAQHVPGAAHRCRTCGVPHHRDCWSWNRGCGIYACRGTRCLAPPPALDLAEARARLAALVLTGCIAFATLAISWAAGGRF